MPPSASTAPAAPVRRDPLRLVVHGAAGRMGQRIIACAVGDGAAPTPFAVVAAVERAGHPRLGADAGTLAGVTPLGVSVAASWACPADVVIDFSLPGAVVGIAAACVRAGVPQESDRYAAGMLPPCHRHVGNLRHVRQTC